MNIEIDINELVLTGFAPDDRSRVGTSIERELTRLISENGMPQPLTRGGAIADLDGESFEMVSGSSPESIGIEVARAVYGGLNR
jgi:hypothetical protein